jgi:YesN/AraC family two-component response regulator
MEDRQLFRRSDLRVGDVASELGTNSTYISACLNSQMGVSFPTFVARYRVACAQDLMRREPDKHLSDVAEEAGFANEASFFRTFKQITGVTPSEWKESKI